MPLKRLKVGDPNDAIVAALLDDGAVIIEGLLDPELLGRFNTELDPLLAAADPERSFVNPAIDFFFGKHTRHLTGVARQSRVFATEILCEPTLQQICASVLGPSCARWQLNIAQVLDRGPGAEPQLLHRDELVWVHLPRPHPEVQVASVIALEDFSAENGATRVIPGSHKWPVERVAEPHETVAAEMPAGSGIIYLGSTIHGGGANTTRDSRRRGMHMSFVVGWLRTEENHYLETPLEVARALPRASQELLGYAVHDAVADMGGYLGTVDLRDPVELIAEGKL